MTTRQDTTNFKKIQCDSLEVSDDMSVPNLSVEEVNDRKDSITVIATMATKAVTLTAEQKKARLIEVTVGHATNVLTLGLTAGQWIAIKNNDAVTAVKVKNIAADTEVSIAAGKSVIIFAGTAGAIVPIPVA